MKGITKTGKLKGKTIESLNIPYFEFLDDEDVADDRLPKDKDIVTVCAKGGSSEYVAEILDGKGFRAASLDGGMKAWSQVYNTLLVHEEEQLKLYQINRLAKGCLSYMIFSKGEAAVVTLVAISMSIRNWLPGKEPKSPTSWTPTSMRAIFPVARLWPRKREPIISSPPVISRGHLPSRTSRWRRTNTSISGMWKWKCWHLKPRDIHLEASPFSSISVSCFPVTPSLSADWAVPIWEEKHGNGQKCCTTLCLTN